MSSLTRRLILLSSVLAFTAVSSCRDAPVRTVSSHPPAADIADPVCLVGEPAPPTIEEINNDLFGDVDRRYTAEVLGWGRRCADALGRSCQWHKDRGAILTCKPEPAHQHSFIGNEKKLRMSEAPSVILYPSR